MRNALYENNVKIWRITEERKEVNSAFSHDLRTPITVIKGYLGYLDEYLKQDNLNKKKITKTLNIMSKNINRVEAYVEMMNTIQKLEDTPINKEKTQLDDFIELFIINFQNLANQQGKNITIDYQKNHTIVKIDSNIVDRVLENILINAFTYAKEKVAIYISIKNQMLIFQVKDDGLGFNKENINEIFTPFYQGENTKGTFALGLAISQILCKKHNGTIQINTVPSGAMVTVSFSIE